MKFSYKNLITLIPNKETGYITAKRLSKMTGYTETFIRKLINEARSAGVPICSTQRGYYFSNDQVDISQTVKFLTRRLQTQLKAIDGLININCKENE